MTTTIRKSDLMQGLRELGLPAGCAVLVHSSLSSFGHVEGGADSVIDALLDTVGPGGTVLVPTLTGSKALSAENPPIFYPLATPCWTGRIPETMRRRPEALRSLHPTHSVAAIGAEAVSLTQSHLDSVSPCDAQSPYGRLAARPDGYILLLGVNHESNTTFHHVEEITGVEYHLQPGFAQAQILLEGRTIIRHIMLHAYGTDRMFRRMEPLLIERGIQRTGEIGQATVRLIAAARMVDITAQCLRADRRILCAQR